MSEKVYTKIYNTNEEADYILHHAPFPQSIRVIIFVGAVYRAAQTVTKTIIRHF